ncbi:phosphotransferase [Arthrobacter castelli]|uniref:phosphotransferase n=1 Tax=Arthrobacter castelli TaxID=271431 RepID=UPI00040AD173|nr:phosphotransferase [Arthrobacter castelli]
MNNAHLQAGSREEVEIALLESAEMGVPLQLALDTSGLDLTDWKLLATHHRPNAGVTGIYETTYVDPAGAPGSGHLCATTATVPHTTTPAVRLDAPAQDAAALTVWHHPQDPLLPGLGWACDPAAVAAGVFGQPDADVRLRTVSYRPMRRAVISAVCGNEEAFLKVVRGGHAGPMYRRHRMLADASVPVPEPYGEPVHDVLALHRLPGTPLANELMANGAAELDPAALITLLRRFPAEAMTLPARSAWATRADDYAQAASAALPAEQDRISNLAGQINRLLPDTDPGPVVPSHGDFYEANLVVDGGIVTGLLDVDAVGPGLLVDELACFIGHLAVLPAVDARYVHVPAALQRFLAAFDTEVDPVGLRIRAAGVALSLVAGAKRTGSVDWFSDARGRLEAAERMAASAAGTSRISESENSLIPGSRTSHIGPAS